MRKVIDVGWRKIGEGQPCFIVGEIGINHQGDINNAFELIDMAAKAGVNAVKFQKRTPELYPETPYASPLLGVTTYRKHKQALELSAEDYLKINEYCRKTGMLWFASSFDLESFGFLRSFDLPVYKVASPCLRNKKLLGEMVELLKWKPSPIIVSTGMSTLEEIDEAWEILKHHPAGIIFLHCVSIEPLKDFAKVNLRCMETLRERYHVPVGYSSHEYGISVATASVALGACVVEKHITLDRAMPGTDHAFSLEYEGLWRLVRDIRNLEKALGDGHKRLYPEETKVREKVRMLEEKEGR